MRLSPDDFWKLSVVEWAALSAALGDERGADGVLDRSGLEALMAIYPDHEENSNE